MCPYYSVTLIIPDEELLAEFVFHLLRVDRRQLDDLAEEFSLSPLGSCRSLIVEVECQH